MINKNSFIHLIVLLSFLINSCSLLPVSDDTKDILNQVKEHIFDEDRFHMEEAEPLRDNKISIYLKKTLQPILDLYHLKNISITAVDAYEAQASIYYGDRVIYISKGMLYSIKNEAELIALLAHEVGHLKLDHNSANKQKGSKVPGIIKDVIESTTGISTPDDIESDARDLYLSQFSQKNEQDADEFGALTAKNLGYDPYLYADLFDRLSEMSDQSIAKKLQSILKGSHKSLSDRAEYIRSFLEKSNIEKSGKTLAENYLKNVSHLAVNLKTSTALTAQKSLTEIHQKLESRSKEKKPLTVEEFISYMQKVRTLAKDLNLLSQLKYLNKISKSDADADFMMESVKVLKPWWAPEDINLKTLNNTLILLSQMAIGAIPVVGDAVDMYEVLTGKDFLTGESLTFGERTASAIGVLAGSGKIWRTVSKKLGVLKSKIIDEKELSKVTKVATDAIEESPILGKANKVIDADKISNKHVKEIEKQYRLIKNEENYKVLVRLAEQVQPKNIDDGFKVKVTKPGKRTFQGLEYTHPDNNHIKIRVMPGDPNSKFPNSKKTYVRQTISGQSIDLNGNKVDEHTNEAHIPLDQWQFTKFWEK